MASEKQVIEFQVRLRDFMTKELKRLGVNIEATSKKGKKGFDAVGRSAEKAGRKIKKAGGGLQGFMRGFAKFGRIVAGMVGLGAGLGGIITMFTKVRQGMQEARGFSQAMAEVGTISETVRHDMEGTTQAVLDLATAFGQNELKTAKALYQTISAGVTDLGEAMYLVEHASRLAVGGFAEVNVVVDFLTGVINAYGKSVYEAEELTDLFFETVRLGKTTIPEMAKQMGAVMPIAANLGVSIEELSAMLATLTLGNIETSLATTYMRQALVAVLQPSEDAQKLMAANKFEFTTAKIAADGFVGVLKEMREKFKGNISAMQKFFPNVRSFIPVLALAGKQWEKFNQILAEFKTLGERDVSPTMQALETAMLSAGKKMEVLGNAARQGFMQLGLGLIEGITGPINSVKDLQDMAFVFRDALAGLKPLVEGVTAAMIAMAGAMALVLSGMGDAMGLEGGEAKVWKQDLTLLSDLLFNMAGSVMGGGTSVGEAFSEMSSQLRSGRKDMVMDALAARKAVEELDKVLDPFAVVQGWGKQVTVYSMADELENMLVKDIPQVVLDGSAHLREAIGKYEATVGSAADMKWMDILPLVKSEGFFGGTMKGYESAITTQLTESFNTFKDEFLIAETRLRRDLGTEAQELEGLLSMKDVINRASKNLVENFAAYAAVLEHTDFMLPGGAMGPPPLMGIDPGTVEAAAAVYETAGKGGAEAYYTALAFELEDQMKALEPDLKDIMGPKYKAAMGWLASKGGETFKDALMVAGGGITFGDLIVSDPGRESQLTQEIYNYTQELERQKLLMADRTGLDKQEKELYMWQMMVEIRKREIELGHRRGDQSKTLWGMDQEAMDASMARAKHQIKVIGDLNLEMADYNEQIALTKVEWAGTITPAGEHLKKVALATLDFEKAVLANEQAMRSGKREFEDYTWMLIGLTAQFDDFKKEADLSETFRKQAADAELAIGTMELAMPELTVEQYTDKYIMLADLRRDRAIAAFNEEVRVSNFTAEQISARLDGIQADYARTVAEIVNGTEQIGFAWQALQFEAQNLKAEFEQIQVYAVNMLADGLAEGMMKMAESADDANLSWKEFGKNFLRTIAVMIMRAYMLQAIMAAIGMLPGGGGGGGGGPAIKKGPLSGYADGGVIPGGLGPMTAFAQGGMVPGGLGRMLPVGAYAQGGVVSQPSYALMGEGPGSEHAEAILPLTRMAGGDLGVKAGGGGATNINISINAVDAKGIDELLVSRQDTLRRIISQAMTESRWFRSAMRGQTGR